MSGGTFSVSRKIWDHEEFIPSPFSEREAFLWIISEAAWKPRNKRVGKIVVSLDRGQLAHSTRFLAEAWDWSHSKVRRFLDRLEKRHMIDRITDTGVSVICVTNYDTYQLSSQPSGTVAAQQPTQKRHSSGTNKNKGEIRGTSNTPIPPQGDFDAFWSAYPRKVGKDAARKSYDRAMKKADHATVMSALLAWVPAQAGKDAQYIPHASTWLNGGRWQDEPEAATPAGPAKPGDTRINYKGVKQTYHGAIAGWLND